MSAKPCAQRFLRGSQLVADRRWPLVLRPQSLQSKVRNMTARLNARPCDPLEISQSRKHIARFRSVGRSQDASEMELVDYPRRSPVTDLQPALEQRRRALLVLDYDLRRLAEQLVAIRIVQVLRVRSASFLGFLPPNGLDDVFLARPVVDD